MDSTKAIRKYLAAIGARGGSAGVGESKMRGGKTRAARWAYYRRISRKGVLARAKARRAASSSHT